MTNSVFHGRHYYQSGPDFTAILLSVWSGLYIDFIISPRQLYNKRNIFILGMLTRHFGPTALRQRCSKRSASRTCILLDFNCLTRWLCMLCLLSQSVTIANCMSTGSWSNLARKRTVFVSYR